MVRTFLPLDLVAILHQGKSLTNKAVTKDNIIKEEARFLTLATLFGQWLHPRMRRCLWVWASGFSFRGLASARNRSSGHVWEIDRLLLDEEDIDCCHSLLEKLVLSGLQSGVEKVFLRLPAGSPLAKAAKKAGFLPYITEILYGLETGQSAYNRDTPPLPARRKQIGDEYRIFELYQKCIPVSIRQIEGMTFREWQEGKNRRAKKEWVFEQEGSLTGWLRMECNGDTGQFEVMSGNGRELEQIISYILLSSASYQHLLCLTREFQRELSRLLQDCGFNEIIRYSVFIKELTVRAQEPCLVPLGA